MHRIIRWAGMGLLFSLGFGVAEMQAQQPVAAEPQASSQTVQTPRELVPTLPVPRLVKFAGTLKDEQGKPRTGAVGVTFAIYKDQEGGAALWLETQNAELDEQGRYTVLLGATRNEGLPLELFASGEPRWLGVQVNLPREVEQPRVLLVSVPYALKASDADTVGGLPASAFVLTQPAAGSTGGTQTGTNPKVTSKTGTKSAASPAASISGSGTVNQVTKFTPDGVTIGNSAITEVNGNVGIGYSGPNSTRLLIAAPTGGGMLNASNLADQDLIVNVTAPGASDKFTYVGPSTATNLALGVGGSEKMRITNAGNVGIGYSGPNSTRLLIAAPKGGGMLNASNLADQDLLVNVTAPGASDKFTYVGPSTATNLALGVGAVEKMRITNTGNVGIGTTTPAQKLSVAGAIQSTSGGFVFPDSTVQATAVPASASVRAITYLAGCDNCSVLTNADSQNVIFEDLIGAMTINSVTCFSDGGSPTINIQVNHGGSLSNVLSSNLTCSTSGATSTSFSTSALSVNDILNFTLVADSVAKRVTTIIKATVN